MAVRKTRNFLPNVFQTDTNEKFLSATMDQLTSEPVLTNLYGYIGRKFAPTFRPGDSYLIESSADRQDYQLEPSTVIQNDKNDVTFFASYVDYVNKLKYYGAYTDNHSRLFDAEYYSFDPLISFDKFVNFSQYYWLPNGPDSVIVDTTGIELDVTYNVTRDVATGAYIFTNNGVIDNSVTLPRGGVYKFVIDQPGFPFWIQTELGADGKLSATPTLSSRDVMGVENNGTDSGTITFTIPQKTAQDRFTSMQTVASIDYATPARYSDWENKTVTQFQSVFPQWSGITGQLNGKQLIFVDQNEYNNEGDTPWTVPNVIDPTTGNVIPGYDAGTIIADDLRYGIWQVQLLDIGINDPLIRLVYVKDVAVNQKVYIRYGLANGNKEYYKDYDGFFHQQPLLSSLLDTLYAQDEVDANINTVFKVVNYSAWTIDVNNDILGKQTYTSPNGVEFTSGLKIEFGGDVTPDYYKHKQYYVEGVGNLGGGIVLVPVDELVTPELYNDENQLNNPGGTFPEYITINRASQDRNAWSRNNRWFHRQVISDTATYRNEIPTFNQSDRAQRPIIQFDSDLLLFNNGRIGKYPIDILDTTTIDAFTQLEGKVLTTAFGVTVTDGMRVIFANDQDPLVKNKIYTLNLVQYTVDANGAPSGPKYIKLVLADDGNVLPYDTVVATNGQNKGKQYWYDGTNWIESQQKKAQQQEPLFDVFDSTFDAATFTINNGRSLSQITRSTFAGTHLFGYLKNPAGVTDPVLGFALSYRNFGTQGDIEFQNYFATDTYNYANDVGVITTDNISTGFLQKIQDRYTLQPKNTWQTVTEFTKQYQQIGYVYDGVSNIFPIDILPKESLSIPYIKVFKNFKYLTDTQWVLLGNQVRLTTSEIFIGDGYTTDFRLSTVTSTVDGVVVLINGIARKAAGYYSVTDLIVTFTSAPKVGDKIDIRVIQNPVIGDKIDILVYSEETSKLGFYQVPQNLDLNAQNIDVNTLTLGQLRNHLVQLGQNSTTVVGDVLGISNLRDIDIKQQGGTILQHSAPIPVGELFLLDTQANFVDSLRYAQKEYTKFKNKFLELSTSLSGITPTDPVASVDLILTEINKIKNNTFPWFYSDMIPYGTLKNTINYTVYDPLKTDYELTNVFIDQVLGNQAVLIYVNSQQLVKGINYEFLYDRPAVRFIDTLSVNDIITIVEYANTNGSYIPETPTKIGLWPRFIPEMFLDDTYRTPIDVIRGHDGSITPAFGDYRDGFLLELELRIFNNIKLPDTGSYGDIFATIPGKYRKSDYTIDEMTQLVSYSFQSWIGNNKLDFSENSTFESNDAFTWNYGAFNDIVDGERMRGSWRAVYQYFYDTFYPHKFPWEMLGFAFMPDWWENYYGPGPYTSGNKLLWDDLEGGIIRQGARSNGQDANGNWIPAVDVHYQRPGLASIIPVDENGFLRPPVEILTQSYQANRAGGAWSIGQYGPVEYAWRTSSEFPYAVQQAIAMAKPGRYFGINLDTYNYSPYNPLIQVGANASYVTQYLVGGVNHHITQTNINYNGQQLDGVVYRGAGYLNWIADYLTSQGINPTNKLDNLLNNYQVKLAYKMAGFTDQSYLNVLAEQVSPGSTNDTIVIPNENYKVYLNKSTPVSKMIYSGVIVERTSNGYSVRGYDLNNPFFTIIPSIVNSNATKITVLNSTATIYRDYQPIKLTVPYGYEFTSQQQIVDFLISYERYLIAQGFTFTEHDGDLGEIRNWKLSAKEFLYWSQQGWRTGSILVLSPVANVLNAISINAITDGISDTQYGSRVVDQNFKLVKNVDYTVLRSPTNFTVTLTDSASVIGYVEVDLVQYEHALIFDNTTVFNDIIYKPELGNRQYRLKLQGQKSANWDGSMYAPGFIYNNGMVDSWEAGQDYLQGDLVTYKNQYYTALQNIIASTDFQYSYWKQISSSEIQTGLLPNFSTIAAESKAYYDSYPSIDNKKQIEYSHGLIGYRPRQYLADLGLTQTTQIEFYKGYIRQKGTFNAVNQLIAAEFNNLTSNISLFEEWAIRIGTYGAIDANPYVEIALDEKVFGVNPSLAEFVYGATNNLGDGVTIFNQSQLHKSTDQYNGNIALNRTTHSNYDNDVLTAGYVNIDDVDTTIFDLANYVELDNELANIGTGYRIWCAKDFSQQWNVYRITETNNFVTEVTNSLNNYITFTSQLPHNLAVNDIFLVRNFNTQYDGFYQVYRVVDLNNVIVKYSGNTSGLTTLTGHGILYVLNSMRFHYMEDSRIYGQPPNGWKVGEKIWIDDDAATTAVQGQPYGTQPSGTWKVYEKHHPWNLKQALPKSTSEYASNDGYGTSVKMSADGLIVVTGSPNTTNIAGAIAGSVNTFFKDYTGEYVERFSLNPTAANTYGFGSTVDLSADASSTNRLAVGAPQSYNNVGYVYTYSKGSDSNSFGISQIIVGDTTNPQADKFGTSIAFNQDGNWLYVGAPGNDKVYIYGLNKFVPYRAQTISVNNQNIIKLTGTLTVSNGDVITESITGARVIVSMPSTASANVQVNSLTNILTSTTLGNITLNGNVTANISQWVTQVTSGANLQVFYTPTLNGLQVVGYYKNNNLFDTSGNIYINGVEQIISTANVLAPSGWSNVGIKPTYVGSANVFVNDVDTGLFVTTTYSTPTTSNLTLGFTPSVTNDATSLLVTSGGKTYIPNIDYVVNSTYIQFITNGNVSLKANIAQSDIRVVQQPYYALLGNVSGNVGSNFGNAISSSFDGAQLAVGAPNDNVLGYQGAGTVWVFDRVIEAFDSTGSSDYVTQNPIVAVYRVTIDGIEVNDYFVVGSNTIRFVTPPEVGKVIYIEVNKFTLLEKLIGIDSLEGGTGAIQANAHFGTSLTICSNNCAIYIGAPNYNNGTEFNTGAVWKFHNRGRLYGTNNGYKYNPVFTPGDTIRLDNFEIAVTARMMPNPTGTGNILALSSNIVAVVGQTISQNQGGGHYANVTVLANTSTAGSQFITVTDYTTAYTFKYGQSSVGANLVSVGGTITSAYPMASLDSLIKDINDANLLGISAVNENNRLRLKSDSTVAKNLLRILAGTTQPRLSNPTGAGAGVYADAELIVFAFMQIIINPFQAAGEYFGSKVKLASNAYMLVIGSGRGTTRGFATFDNDTTTLDQASTRMFDHIQGSGSVYIYELYDDPRNEVEHPGRYAFAQQLNPGDLNPGDQFGYALDIEGQYITISAPSDDTVTNNAGSVYIFENPTLTRGWKLIRYEQPKVDVDSVTRMYLYSTTTNTILDNLQFIDPAKGRILGQAEQEITYKTEYDPAIYNRGNNVNADINSSLYWDGNQVGQVWWNLSKVRYIDYEQDTLIYRSRHWGETFPGSTIEVLEWVESNYLPSQYVANGGDGQPKYADNSAYVEITYVDPTTNIITSKYYYWVINKTTVDPNNPTRNIPTSSIADIIANPKSQGIAYAAVIQSNAVILYNIGSYLSAKNTILHLDYQLLMNTNIIHAEYQLLQKGNPDNFVPDRIVNKLVDSLSGIDAQGSVVPDPRLSVADSYGIDIRPRQSMFINRLAAVNELVAYVNGVLINKPIARQYSLVNLNSAELEPNFKLGEYDRRVETEVELQYIDANTLPIGYKILVATDTSQDNLWVLYQLQSDYTWQIIRVQSYKTNLYWDYVDWFDYKPDGTRYSLSDKLDYVVPTLTDAKKLSVASGEEILVRVNNSSDFGGWSLLIVNSNLEFQVVGIENGTIQFKTSLGDFSTNELGFGNQGYATDRYDQNPNIEIRNIIYALKNDIFIDELQGEFNKTFFVMVNYLFSEQKYIDWIFKTSFISATHKLRTLSQFPSYIKDNQTYYQSYIDEVKPYRTKVREYLLNYTGSDEYPSTVTDFDLPPYYDTTSKVFRSPSGEIPDTDEAMWQTYPYNQWYDNRKLIVDSIIVENPGEGYTVPPTVTVINGAGGGAGATAVAYLNGNTGAVSHIEVTNSGKGYITTPTVVVNGSCITPATAYAVIKNQQVRSFDTTLKFDRITYTSTVKEWAVNTAYTAGDIVTYANRDGNAIVRRAYTVKANMVSGSTFVNSDYTVFAANAFTNANDRIIGYYQPGLNQPARDLKQLVYGIEYPGVQVQGADYNQQPGFSGPTTANITLSTSSNVAITIGSIIIQGNGSLTVTTVYNSTKLNGVVNSYGFDSALGNISVLQIGTANLLPTNSSLTDIKYKFSTGTPFGAGGFDNVTYDQDGNPMLSDSVVDTIIQSNYTDAALGTRAEDINVDGGAYVDRYSSHAPEEMIPGIVFDTLDMRVFTQSDSHVYGYRIFNNMLRQTSYIRISDNQTTSLTNALSISDTTITVANVQVLPTPDPTTAYPGVVFIGAERITYWTSNVATNTLGQIRRGTQGTSVANTYPIGTLVTDASHQQVIPGTVAGNVTLTANTAYTVTDIVSYELQLSNVITANVGDTITQYASGANVTFLSYGNAAVNSVIVSYNSTNQFNFLTGNVIASSNIAVNGTYTGNVYPINSNIAGSVNTAGNITVTNGTLLQTANIWLNLGTNVATDGTGLIGATTVPALFIKSELAILNSTNIKADELITEDAINMLSTEDGTVLTEE